MVMKTSMEGKIGPKSGIVTLKNKVKELDGLVRDVESITDTMAEFSKSLGKQGKKIRVNLVGDSRRRCEVVITDLKQNYKDDRTLAITTMDKILELAIEYLRVELQVKYEKIREMGGDL